MYIFKTITSFLDLNNTFEEWGYDAKYCLAMMNMTGALNIILSSQYRNSHYKGKTVSRLSYIHNGNAYM